MYPLVLKPVIKDYLWGGTKLKQDFRFETESEIAAEAWMLSAHKDGMNIVTNGEHAGKTFAEVLNIWGKCALGKNAETCADFPILIKLIDAKEKLSVQVHPDDEYARLHEGGYGKTEMWYIVDCQKDAQLLYGFEKDVLKDEFERHITNNTLQDICRYVPVKKGDVFFIPAGTLHAIGEGILIAEVQQNSNNTYRVFDYNRPGADGKPRELHIEKALDVTDLKATTLPYGNFGRIIKEGSNTIRELTVCEQFTANLLKLKGKMTVAEKDTFVSLVVIDGNLSVSWGENNIDAKKGDSIFVPANFEVELNGDAEVLYCFV